MRRECINSGDLRFEDQLGFHDPNEFRSTSRALVVPGIYWPDWPGKASLFDTYDEKTLIQSGR